MEECRENKAFQSSYNGEKSSADIAEENILYLCFGDLVSKWMDA